MDGLSQLLLLYPVRTSLDTRCRASAAWGMERAAAPAGAAPYHLVVEGAAMLRLAGHPPLRLDAGDVLVLVRGQAHVLEIGAGDQAGGATEILCGQFHFGLTAAGSLADSLPDLILVRSRESQEMPGLQALMRLLGDEARAVQPGVEAVTSHLASALLALILRAWMKQAGAAPGLLALLGDRRLAPTLHAMLKTPEQAWTLEQLAGLCNMSRSTFLRAFRQRTGVTPGELLTRVRMTRASAWLEQPHRGVAEVGAAVGYQSEAAFQRAFKRYTGRGPGQYRRERFGRGAAGEGAGEADP